MKELSLNRPDLSEKISFYHLALLLASLPFDRFYSHVILISFALHVIIQFKKTNISAVSWSSIVILQSVFFITIGSTIYATNKSAAMVEWGRQVTVLLFPLIFHISGFDFKKHIHSLLSIFSIVCVITVLYLYFDALHTIRFYKLPYSTLFGQAFINHNFSGPIDMHATFLSMQLGIALVHLIVQMVTGFKLKLRRLYLVGSIILLAGIVQLCSKSVFVCLLLAINVVIPMFLLHGSKRRNYLLATCGLYIFIIGFFFTSTTFRARYIGDLKTDLTEKNVNQTAESRLSRWQVAAGLIKQSPVIGHGAGSEVDLLQEKFFEKKYYNSFLHQLNAHNQYLSFLIKSGIWGLVIYLFTLFWGFKQALQSRNVLFITFMMLIAIVSMSENLLDVDKGIIFYAFFFSLFVFANNKVIPAEKPKNTKDYLTELATERELVTS